LAIIKGNPSFKKIYLPTKIYRRSFDKISAIIKEFVSAIINQKINHLEDLDLATLKAVELDFEIPQIPKSNCLVGRTSCCQDKFRVWVETQAVNLHCVSIHSVAWSVGDG
jgi:hypothetical protein